MSPSTALHVIGLVSGRKSRDYLFACRLLAYGKAARVRAMAASVPSTLFVLAA